MSTVRRFEDLRVWQLAREIVNDIYQLTNIGPFSKDFALMNHIRRSAISVLSNIAEGFEAGTDKKFANYVNIAKSSAGECRAQLYLALDQSYIDKNEFELLKEKLISVSKQLSKLETYLRSEQTNRVNDFEIKYRT